MIKITGTMEGDGYERGRFFIDIDDKRVFRLRHLDESPEDAIFARDLPSFEIIDLMEQAYNLGKSGEEVEFVKVGED